MAYILLERERKAHICLDEHGPRSLVTERQPFGRCHGRRLSLLDFPRSDCFLTWRSHGRSRSQTLVIEVSSLRSTFTPRAFYEDFNVLYILEGLFLPGMEDWYIKYYFPICCVVVIIYFSCVQTPLNRLLVCFPITRSIWGGGRDSRARGLGSRSWRSFHPPSSPFLQCGRNRVLSLAFVVFGTTNQRAQGHTCYVWFKRSIQHLYVLSSEKGEPQQRRTSLLRNQLVRHHHPGEKLRSRINLAATRR